MLVLMFVKSLSTGLLASPVIEKPDFPKYANHWSFLRMRKKSTELTNKRSTNLYTSRAGLFNHILFNLNGCVGQKLPFFRLDFNSLCMFEFIKCFIRLLNFSFTFERDLQLFYIQIKIYNICYILPYFLIITIRHYRDNTKRSEITRLPHGYMKQDEDNTRKLYATKQRGDEKHRRTTLYK